MLSIWNSLKLCRVVKSQPFPKQVLVFMCLLYKSFGKTVGKGEITCNEQFLLFPLCLLPFLRTFIKLVISPFSTVFSTLLENFLPFSSNLELSSANSFTLEKSRIGCLGKV